MHMFKKLSGCIREYKKVTLLTPVFIVFEVIMECLIPFIIAKLVNEIKAGCEFGTIAFYGGILFVMACLSLACGAVAGATCAKASAGFAKNMRHDLFYRIQEFSFENIDRFSSSSLVTRLTTDVTNVQFAFMMLIRTAIRCPLMFLFACVMSFIMGGKLALMFVVVIPLLGFGLYFISRKAMPMFRRVFRKYDTLNESIQENVAGMRVVKSFVREDYEKEKFDKAADSIRIDFTKAERLVAWTSPLMQFCLYVVMIVVLYFGSGLIISTSGAKLDVGQFSAMLTYGFQILSSLMMLSMIYVVLTFSAESARRIFEILKENSTLKSKPDACLEVPDGSIDFLNVNFKYSEHAERFALENINLHIRSGQTIGILGGTGSSKSTLVQLIPRLYDVSDGAVCVGEINVKDYDLSALRNQVAVVLQKNVLFSGTIRDNLKWGNPNATDEELKDACRMACADEFISAFPDGYDTWIEQGGANVSGGQKQRLCIARALLKKPKVLILDDSTSAVDTKTDAMIRKSMHEYIPSTTKIIIAQRIASVQDADMILMMESGKITAAGTHEMLLRTNEMYRDIYHAQNRCSENAEE